MNLASASANGIERPARWSLRLFGGFELSLLPGGEKVASLGKRERVLLAVLALSPKGQPRRKLAALLWGDATDETLLDNLRACIWKLRKALGDTEHRAIASEGEDVVLDSTAFEIDAWTFRELAAQSGRQELEAAVNLYSGEFLDGLEIDSEDFESWRRTEATSYRDRAIDVLNRLMTQFCASGDSKRAIETGERILHLEPLHEAAIRRLMRLYGESERRGAAVQLYRRLADGLRDEVGAQPEAETRALFAEIARGGEDRTPAPAAPPPPAATDAEPSPSHTDMASPRNAPCEPLAPPTQQLARAVGPSEQVAPLQVKTRKPNWIVASTLTAVIAIFLVYQFSHPTPPGAQQPTRTEAAKRGSSSVAGTISIAVLPFENLSGDSSQEFFSDGMTQEITSALAKITDLRVVGRTSAFQFKGEKKDLRAIGQALIATHLLEGSVRKVGTRIRVAVQLIKTDDGKQIWSESYDRELTDVFAIQEDIATAIAGALRTPLGLKAGERLVGNRNIDPESYQQYLRARALVRARGTKPLADASALLEQVVAHDPDFAPAWAMLAQANFYTPFFAGRSFSADELRRLVNASFPRAEAAARRTIQLDPNLAEGFLSLAESQNVQRRLLPAEDMFKKALALDPNNPDALEEYSNMLAGLGRLKEALAIKQQLLALEPVVPIYNYTSAQLLWLNGQSNAAIAMLKNLTPAFRGGYLPMIYTSMGRFNEAADIIRGAGNSPTAEEAARLLRTAPTTTSSPENLPRLAGDGYIYISVGAPNRALEFEEELVDAGVPNNLRVAKLWHPLWRPARKSERFKAILRKFGYVEYWRARGWPEFCHPTIGDDFACN